MKRRLPPQGREWSIMQWKKTRGQAKVDGKYMLIHRLHPKTYSGAIYSVGCVCEGSIAAFLWALARSSMATFSW